MFQPSPENPLDFEDAIEKTVLDLAQRFALREVRYDPFQMAATAQRLTRAGVPMVEFPQSVPNLVRMGQNLFELIKGRNISVYADEGMRTSVSRAIAVETARGWRIAKEKASHKIDVVVALAMAALAAIDHDLGAGGNIIEFYRRQAQTVADNPLAPPEPPEFGFGFRPVAESDEIRVRAPGDTSTLFGITGRTYLIPADRIVAVHRDDAAALRGAGGKFMDIEGVQL
jgi:hypothetical protein